MADAKMYAWSPIRSAKVTDEGPPLKVEHVQVKQGDEVTAAKLGISKEAFQDLVDSGAVRPQEFPKVPEGYQDSPVNFMREQALRAADEADADLSLYNDPSMVQSTPRNPSDVVAGRPTGDAPGL